MKKTNSVRRCRLCACEEEFCSLSNIFNDNPEMELEAKITKLLPIVVMPWDPMPHTICQKCTEKLNLFNEFYESCIRAERFLLTLYPSAPENELENLNPVDISSENLPPMLPKSPLKLPPKKRQGREMEITPEFVQSAECPKKTLSCFIINHITTRDSVFTCRKCFRTFTKQSSALTHSCVRVEDCGEIETIDLDDEDEKSLPPLKLRLFSVRSGLFICYLCQAPFEKKSEVVEHVRRHILEDGKKRMRQKSKRKGRSFGASDEDEWEESNKKKTVRKKRKKSTDIPKRKGKAKTGEECQSETCERCKRCHESSTTKETTEQTTQYSEDCLEPTNTEEQPNIPNSPGPNAIVETPKTPEPDFEPVEIAKEAASDEITVLEVINNRTPASLSSCVFCDKIFATKEALIAHQNKHMQGVLAYKLEKNNLELEQETFLCSVCAMIFTNLKTLLEHEEYHLADVENVECQREIRIALNQEYTGGEIEQECQISKGRGIIRITVTSSEKRAPQIEFR